MFNPRGLPEAVATFAVLRTLSLRPAHLLSSRKATCLQMRRTTALIFAASMSAFQNKVKFCVSAWSTVHNDLKCE